MKKWRPTRGQAEVEERRLAELAEIKQKAEIAAQERAAREADLQRQLEGSLSQAEANQVNRLQAGETSLKAKQQVLSQIEAELQRQSESLAQAKQEHSQRLQAAETSLQAKQEELLQIETELQQRSEEKKQHSQDCHAQKTLKKVEAEAQQRAAQEQQLTAEIAALRIAEANELNVIKKLEEDVEEVRSEAERLSALEGQLNAELYLLKTTLAAQQRNSRGLKDSATGAGKLSQRNRSCNSGAS